MRLNIQSVTQRNPVPWMLFFVAVLSLFGCQAYRDGSQRTVGEITDDARIQTQVKSALIREEDVPGFPMNIEVHRGVVSLYGRISSDEARARAIRIAGSVKGVVEVKDRLTLVPSN